MFLGGGGGGGGGRISACSRGVVKRNYEPCNLIGQFEVGMVEV